MNRWRELEVGDKGLAPAWDQQQGTVVGTDGIGFLALWSDRRTDSLKIFGTPIDAAGRLLYPAGMDLGLEGTPAQIIWNGRSYAVFAWTVDGWVAGEMSGSGLWVRTPQRIFDTDDRRAVAVALVDDGYIVASLIQEHHQWIGQIRVTKLARDFSTVVSEYEVASGSWPLAIAHRGDDVLLAWVGGGAIHLLHLHADGSIAKPLISEPISFSTISSSIALVATSECYLVAWGDGERVEIARVTDAGLSTDRVNLPTGTDSPHLAWNGSSATIAVSAIVAPPADTDVYSAQLDPVGNIITPLAPVSTARGDQGVTGVAATPASSLIVWDDFRDGLNVFAAVLASSQGVIRPEFLIGNSLHGQVTPFLSHNESARAVVWAEGANPNETGVVGEVVDENGRSIQTPFVPGAGVIRSFSSLKPGFALLWLNSSRLVLSRVTNDGTLLDQSPLLVPFGSSLTNGVSDDALLLDTGRIGVFHWSNATFSSPVELDKDVTYTDAVWTGNRFIVAGTRTYYPPCNPGCDLPVSSIVLQAVDASANPISELVALPGAGVDVESAIASSNSRVVVAYSTLSGYGGYQSEFDVVEVDPQTLAIRRTLQVIRSGFCGDSCTAAHDIRIAPVGDEWFVLWSWRQSDSNARILSKGRSAAVIARDFTLHEVAVDREASQWRSYDLDAWNGRVVIAASFPGETEVPRVRLIMQPRNRPRAISR